MPIHPDMIPPVEVKWKTFASAYKDRLAETFKNYDKDKIEIDLIKDISSKYHDLDKNLTKVGITEYALICVLLFCQFGREIDVSILGVSLKNVVQYKEWILLFYSVLIFYTSHFGLERQHMKTLLEFLIELKFDSEQQTLAKTRFLGQHASQLFSFLAPKNLTWHKIAYLPLGIYVVCLLLFIMIFVFTLISIPIIVTIDIATQPQNYATYAIIVISVLSILTTFAAVMFHLPLPVNDYRGIQEIVRLKKDDPDEYQRQLRLKALDNESKQKNREYFIICAVASVTVLTLSALFDRISLINDFSNYVRMMHTIIIVLIVSIPLINIATKTIHRIYWSNNDSFDYQSYRKYKIALFLLTYAIPFVLSGLIFYVMRKV